MLSVDGVGRDHPRYRAAEQWVRRNFNTNDQMWGGNQPHGNLYSMYNLTPAMRLAPGGPI